MLILVLNKVEFLEGILKDFVEIGIKGATIIDSMGMAKALGEEELNNIPIFGSIKMLIDESYPYNKTIFAVLKDEQVPTAIKTIKKNIGDLSKPGVGIVFTIPVTNVVGK